jgi:hypothetical protein
MGFEVITATKVLMLVFWFKDGWSGLKMEIAYFPILLYNPEDQQQHL